MQVPKLKVLIEAGVVGEVAATYDANADGWNGNGAGRGDSPPSMRWPAVWLGWA
jgi:hypothetical protein